MLRLFCLAITFFQFMIYADVARADVGIVNRQNSAIHTRDMHFVDEAGSSITLDRYFQSGRPVLMALVYFGCPGACTVLLNEMIAGLKNLDLDPGKAFEIVVVSIDPKDSVSLAYAKKERYLKEYERKNTAQGWHFLTGTESNILALSHEIGFQFEFSQETQQYIHPSALFVLTPSSVLSSVLTGLKFPKKLLRIALLTAAGGRVGTFWDRVSSICNAYLPHRGWLDRPERWLMVIAALSLGLCVGFVYRSRGF